MSASPSDYVRQLLERLRPDRRMSLAIGLGVVACFALAYNDALEDMRPPDPSLPASGCCAWHATQALRFHPRCAPSAAHLAYTSFSNVMRYLRCVRTRN